jgi:hypothetical protein
MSEGQPGTQPPAQAGSPGEAAVVGLEVGGVHSNDELNWLDLWALSAQTRANLKSAGRNAACSHARQRSEGAGDGSQEITTPQKLRKLQRALYRKAKAEPAYRFWSLYSELTRRELLEYALQVESSLDRAFEYLAMKRFGKPDTGNPSVRFDEGSESDGHWFMPFNPSAPAYSTPELKNRFDCIDTIYRLIQPPPTTRSSW